MSDTLTISRPLITGEQHELFARDREIERPAAVRVHVGAFFEAATAVLFRAQRHQIDSTMAVNPDLSVGRHRYLEVKSVGLSRQGLIYKHRLQKDRELIKQTRGSLCYVFWIHNVEAMTYSSLAALRSALGRGVEEVLCIPFERLWRACRKLRALVCNHRPGARGGPREPMLAYRLPFRLLRRLASRASNRAWTPAPFKVLGHEVTGVRVSGPDIGRCLPLLTTAQRAAAMAMESELAETRLDVVLQPAPIEKHLGHCVRMVQGRNPVWYRDLCATLTSTRKKPRLRLHDTDIRRHLVIKSLQRLGGGRLRWPYDFHCLPYVEHAAGAL